MKAKSCDEWQSEKKVRGRTANVSADENRTNLPQASAVKVVKVPQKVIEVERLIPVNAVRMVKHPANRRHNEREKQQANEP